jgi:hypothetical protein
MTTDEARLILQTYRKGGEDESDPHFAEALAVARADAALGAWFGEQQVFDAAMRDSLASLRPPADLRAAILTTKNEIPQKARSSFAWSWAIAAAFAFLLGIGFFMMQPRTGTSEMTVASFTREALAIKEQNRIVLGTKNTDPRHLRAWLAERGAPHDFVIPPGLQGIPSLGCQSYLVNGTKVALICFDLGHNQVAHLFVVDKSFLADASSETQPQLQSKNGLAFATWSAGGKSFVLTGDNVTEETLRRLI